MLIAFCILYLTYLLWPGVGAIWTRSANESPGTDELREFTRSGGGCEYGLSRSSRAFSETDAFLSRLRLGVMQGELEDVFSNHGKYRFC